QVLQRVLPRMAGGSGKAAANCHRRGEARVGGPDRARVVFAVPAVLASGATQTSRSLERYWTDWGSALLCFGGFERCMGQSRILFSGRASPSAFRCGSSTGLFQRGRTIMGQSCL